MPSNRPNNFHAKQVQSERRAQQRGRGRDAERPRQIPAKGWKDILWRLVTEISDDRVPLIAAGTTFYLLLALFPALAAFVSIYGFVADPKTIAEHIAFLGGVLPSGGLDLIRSQLEALARQDAGALSFGFTLGLAVALWSANNGIKTIFEAMNIAYEETEKRSFVRLNLLAFAFTLGAIFIGIAFLVSVGLVPAALALLNLGSWTETLIRILRWPMMLVAVAAGITLTYRYGPSREKAKWRWLTWGAGLATVVWLAASIGFSFYLENFANYNATYGTLGALIGFMMWTWISVMILIVGAELNSEMEHQTAKDSTTGAPQPIGARGAEVADTLGRSAERSGAKNAPRGG
jgi:membrane protein